MYRIEWKLKNGKRLEHYAETAAEATEVWYDAGTNEDVTLVCAYERWNRPHDGKEAWRLVKWLVGLVSLAR